MSEKNVPFTPENAAILLIDHQPGVVDMIGSLPHEVITTNVGILARLGELTSLASRRSPAVASRVARALPAPSVMRRSLPCPLRAGDHPGRVMVW